MPPATQRRRRTGNHEEDNDPDESISRRRQARRAQDSDDEEDASEGEQQDDDVDMDRSGGSEAQLVHKLVRYALACEYARIPIKRDGIREKVLGNNARSFKRVFDDAQTQLRQVFGVEMAELPVKEKRTLKEKQSRSRHFEIIPIFIAP